MSLMFAEYGIHVHFFDPSEQTAHSLETHARESKLASKMTPHGSYESLCKALGQPKVFVFSVPHGSVADKTIEGLLPFLEKGDVLMDASNEKWTETERRQKMLEPEGVHYIGMGVSGGYQSARRGPSISPGGSEEALDLVFPFLQKIAAKDKDGRPCVAKLGPGGCGHYVKMVHNGIEQGMMTALGEVWAIMNKGLSMRYEEIADVFGEWSGEGGLRDNFLIDIGADICRTRDPNTGGHVLANVRDKVVQDADDSEGTGIWTCEEAIRLHIPSPTIVASHLFRLSSADASRREVVQKSFGSQVKSGKLDVDRKQFLDALNGATYAAFLASFVQGLHILARASEENDWNIDFRDVLKVWRAGCIIRSNAIADLLDDVYRSEEHDSSNLLGHSKIGAEFARTYSALKKVVLSATEADLNVPALSASLEYYKVSGSTDLPPMSFEEAELDYFGEHMFDLKTEEPGKPVTGSHHFEWHPARGIHSKE